MVNKDILTVNCAGCGKTYRINIAGISANHISSECTACGHGIDIYRREDNQHRQMPMDGSKPGGLPTRRQWLAQMQKGKTDNGSRVGGGTQSPIHPNPTQSMEKSLFPAMGVTARFMLYTLLPLMVISIVSILFSLHKMGVFQNETILESTRAIKGISENLIRQISTTVARQTRQYLFTNPDLRKDEFNRDIYFKKTALQGVGRTGATSLYEIPGPDGVWRFWAHLNPELVGIDAATLAHQLGNHFDDFWRVFTSVRDGRQASGYFKWPQMDGSFRNTYMVCTPVEGTPYVIAASILLEEFTKPLEVIEEKGQALAVEIRNTNLAVSGIGILLIAFFIFLYGRNLTGRIKQLSQTTDRISLGELDEEIVIGSRDEIGELGEAISRMQDSIRISIQRLRRQKGR